MFFYKQWKKFAFTTRLKCDQCDKRILYFLSYDAEFCPQCNKWITKNCGDPDCLYCANRPETPELAKEKINKTLENK